MKMRAKRLNGIGDLRVEDVELRDIKGDELLMKIEACGICGSDIPRAFKSGAHKMPITIGHEFSGTIIKAANDNDQEIVGKAAAVFPLIPCMECESCRSGHYAQCSHYDYLGSRCDGGFAEYCIIPSRWQLVFSESEQPSFEELCMVEPATVAQHAIRRGGVSGGKTVLIIGAGPIGMIAARWAKIFGARKVILSEINEEKIEFARERGFTVCNAGNGELREVINEITQNRGVDVVIEGTGSSPGLNSAIEAARPFGTVVLMGNPGGDTTIRNAMHSQILRKELSLTGVWNSSYKDNPINEWEYTVEMIDNGVLKVDDLVTHKTDLNGLPDLMTGIYDRSITICKAIYSASVG